MFRLSALAIGVLVSACLGSPRSDLGAEILIRGEPGHLVGWSVAPLEVGDQTFVAVGAPGANQVSYWRIDNAGSRELSVVECGDVGADRIEDAGIGVGLAWAGEDPNAKSQQVLLVGSIYGGLEPEGIEGGVWALTVDPGSGQVHGSRPLHEEWVRDLAPLIANQHAVRVGHSIARDPETGAIALAFRVYDRRMPEAGWVERASERGKVVRSGFVILAHLGAVPQVVELPVPTDLMWTKWGLIGAAACWLSDVDGNGSNDLALTSPDAGDHGIVDILLRDPAGGVLDTRRITFELERGSDLAVESTAGRLGFAIVEHDGGLVLGGFKGDYGESEAATGRLMSYGQSGDAIASIARFPLEDIESGNVQAIAPSRQGILFSNAFAKPVGGASHMNGAVWRRWVPK